MIIKQNNVKEDAQDNRELNKSPTQLCASDSRSARKMYRYLATKTVVIVAKNVGGSCLCATLMGVRGGYVGAGLKGERHSMSRP